MSTGWIVTIVIIVLFVIIVSFLGGSVSRPGDSSFDDTRDYDVDSDHDSKD